MSEQRKYWAVERPLNPFAAEPVFEICRCDSAATVAAVVAALIGSGDDKIVCLTIRRVENVTCTK